MLTYADFRKLTGQKAQGTDTPYQGWDGVDQEGWYAPVDYGNGYMGRFIPNYQETGGENSQRVQNGGQVAFEGGWYVDDDGTPRFVTPTAQLDPSGNLTDFQFPGAELDPGFDINTWGPIIVGGAAFAGAAAAASAGGAGAGTTAGGVGTAAGTAGAYDAVGWAIPAATEGATAAPIYMSSVPAVGEGTLAGMYGAEGFAYPAATEAAGGLGAISSGVDYGPEFGALDTSAAGAGTGGAPIVQSQPSWTNPNPTPNASLGSALQRYLGAVGQQSLGQLLSNPSNLVGGLGALYSTYQQNQTANRLMDLFAQYQQPAGWYGEQLKDTYVNPQNFLSSPEYQATQRVVGDYMQRQDAAGGRLAADAGRQKLLQDHAMTTLEQYRTGLRSMYSNLAGISTGQGAQNAIQQSGNVGSPIFGWLGDMYRNQGQ